MTAMTAREKAARAMWDKRQRKGDNPYALSWEESYPQDKYEMLAFADRALSAFESHAEPFGYFLKLMTSQWVEVHSDLADGGGVIPLYAHPAPDASAREALQLAADVILDLFKRGIVSTDYEADAYYIGEGIMPKIAAALAGKPDTAAETK